MPPPQLRVRTLAQDLGGGTDRILQYGRVYGENSLEPWYEEKKSISLLSKQKSVEISLKWYTKQNKQNVYECDEMALLTLVTRDGS
jgi:hypothetical protein